VGVPGVDGAGDALALGEQGGLGLLLEAAAGLGVAERGKRDREQDGDADAEKDELAGDGPIADAQQPPRPRCRS